MTARQQALRDPTGSARAAVPYRPEDAETFNPAQIASLTGNDEVRVRTSKKTQEVREAEIRSGASEALIKWVKDKGGLLLRETGASLVLVEIMLFAEGDKTAASQTLLRATSADHPCEDSPHPIDLPHSSRLYKTLLQGGHFNRATSGVEKAPGWDASAFAAQFLDSVGKEVCIAMCTKGARNGAFVIAKLCEASKGDDGKAARKTLKGWFGAGVAKDIEAGEAKGRKLLLEKISALFYSVLRGRACWT
ncbi:hypothetical protein C8J57DRAFT_65160, partial [Mycena rebaudengoi]